MVLAHAAKADIADEHDFVILLGKKLLRMLPRVLPEPAEHLGIHPRDAGRRLDQTFPVRVLADRRQDLPHGPLDPRQINWNGPEVYNYNFRQLPQGENSLGFVKINFPNKDSVYLHDTPLKSLFGKAVRFESSGCVRVHNVEQLVAWILHDTPGWNYQRIVSMKHTGEQIDVKVSKPVPIYLAYITGWGTPDGQVHFGRDIYGLDGASTTASAY